MTLFSPPYGRRLGSFEQPSIWLRPHKGEQIPHLRRRSLGVGLSLYATAKLLQVVELCNTLLEFLTLPLTPPFYGRGWGRLLFGVKVSFQYIQEVLLVDDPVEGGDESVFGVSPVQE